MFPDESRELVRVQLDVPVEEHEKGTDLSKPGAFRYFCKSCDVVPLGIAGLEPGRLRDPSNLRAHARIARLVW